MQKTKSQVQRTLESVRELRKQIRRLHIRLEELEGRCSKQTGSYGIRPRGGGLSAEEIWDMLCDERNRLSAQQEKLLRLERIIERQIDHLPHASWRLMLRYRYLDDLSFGQIRNRLEQDLHHCYSDTQLYRIHRSALEALERQWSRP